MAEGMKIWGSKYLGWGHNLLHLVEKGLTGLPKSGGRAPLHPCFRYPCIVTKPVLACCHNDYAIYLQSFWGWGLDHTIFFYYLAVKYYNKTNNTTYVPSFEMKVKKSYCPVGGSNP